MKIAEVSKEYGLSADTLRYYERICCRTSPARQAASATTASKIARACSS